MLDRRWIHRAHFALDALGPPKGERGKREGGGEERDKDNFVVRVVIVGITNVNTTHMNTQHTELKRASRSTKRGARGIHNNQFICDILYIHIIYTYVD